MFYQAYELFDNGKYHECLPMFLATAEETDDSRFLYWSLIFAGRCTLKMGNPGAVEFFERAMSIFPDRAEAIYEAGAYHYSNGNLLIAERLLTVASTCNKNHNCIRYEEEKYFESPYEVLIDLFLEQHRFNEAEELSTSLMRVGDKTRYDQERFDRNHLYARFYNNAGLEFARAKTVQHGDTLVIQLPHGYDGLGDNLVFSHIPRIAKESGKFKRVLISNLNRYKGSDYADIVWSTNPYVDGFTDLPGTYSSVQMNRVMDKWNNLFPSLNLMDSIMILHDLDNGTRGNVPECHYRPNRIESLSDKIVLDVGARTIDLSKIDPDRLLGFLRERGIFPDFVLSNGTLDFKGVEEIKTDTIQEWADVMYSARCYVCFNSGGYWLSSALGIKGKHIWIERKNLPAWSYLGHDNLTVSMSTIYREGT